MSDNEGSECEGCRWTRNEMARLRAKLVKADRLAEQAAKTLEYSFYMEPVFYLGLESSLKEYRAERTE